MTADTKTYFYQPILNWQTEDSKSSIRTFSQQCFILLDSAKIQYIDGENVWPTNASLYRVRLQRRVNSRKLQHGIWMISSEEFLPSFRVGFDTAFPGGFPGGSDGKESACNARDLGSIPGLGRFPGGGNGNPLQYSCWDTPMDRGAWWATVQTEQLSTHKALSSHY